MTNPAPGWYPDPQDPSLQRYWDGQSWTQHSAPRANTAPARTSSKTMWIIISSCVAVFLILGILGTVGLVQFSKSESKKNAITQTQFDALPTGVSTVDVMEALGEPYTYSVPAEGDGADYCWDYNKVNGNLLDGYSFCFDTSAYLVAKYD